MDEIGRGRVLVADDDFDIRWLIAMVLRLRGYQVVSVANGAAALSEVESGGLDLVVVDAHLPVISGFGVLFAIELSHNPFVPVVMLSARSSPRDIAPCDPSAGAEVLLSKPFSLRVLTHHVDTLLTGRRGGVPRIPKRHQFWE